MGDNNRPNPVVKSSAEMSDPGIESQVKTAVYAVFDGPIDSEKAASFVCAASKKKSSSADWNYKVDRYDIKVLSESSARVDVTLRATDGKTLTTTVDFAKTNGKWLICD